MIWPFIILYVLIGGIALIFAKAVGVISLRQAAIAKALFARIPVRQPSRTEILRRAKEDMRWTREGESPTLFPQAAMMNSVAEEVALERLMEAQRAPKLD